MEAVSPVMPGSAPFEIVLAEYQPEYTPLPVFRSETTGAPIISRWRLTDEERTKIVAGADIVLQLCTFGAPYPPTNLQVVMPDDFPEILEIG